MKKMFRAIFFALMLSSLLSSLVVGVGNAATPTATPISTGNQAVIRFDMIGQTDALLRGPYGTFNARFGLPANWAFKDGASLQLIITANLVTDAAQSVAGGQFIGSTLNVKFNNNDIATIPLLAGPNVTYDVPIPSSALHSPMSDGRHELLLFLDAGNDCNDNSRHTSIVISAASHFTIPYAE